MLFQTFLRLFLSSLCGMAAHIALLEDECHPDVPLPWEVVLDGYMACVDWHPHECQDPGFPGSIVTLQKDDGLSQWF